MSTFFLIFSSIYDKIYLSYIELVRKEVSSMDTFIKKLESFDDFSLVFKVFESFPFFEKWTQEEIRKEFDLNLSKGHIFGYYKDNLCVGFISMREQQPNEHPVHYNHGSKVIYFSDIAVLPQYRRQGIATKLFEYAINVAISEEYQYAYLRINDNNPMAFDIAKKHGFVKEYDLYEIVSRPHSVNNKKNTEEFRIFMSRKLC